MTAQYFQSLTLQSEMLLTAAVHCTPCEYASGMKASVMLSSDEYRGTLCLSPLIHFTPEATALHQSH
jgi:hypothetical protein